MTIQPTIEELRIAFSLAKEIQSTHDLKRIRDRKTTWYGRDELELRREIDTYLRLVEHGVSIGNYMAHKYPNTV